MGDTLFGGIFNSSNMDHTKPRVRRKDKPGPTSLSGRASHLSLSETGKGLMKFQVLFRSTCLCLDNVIADTDMDVTTSDDAMNDKTTSEHSQGLTYWIENDKWHHFSVTSNWRYEPPIHVVFHLYKYTKDAAV